MPLILPNDLNNLAESSHILPHASLINGAMHRGQDFFERQFYTEYGLRKAMEENIAKGKEEIENMKRLWEVVSRELRMAVDNKSLLESQIEKSNVEIKELEEKIISAVDLLQKVKCKCDIYQMERDTALQENEELKKLAAQGQSVAQFSCLELQKATNRFDQTSMIGEGGYRSTYKGSLCHTEVAIKMFDCSGISGPREFNQQVAILNKLRHPKIVTLIGICPESLAFVYEYLPGGSLEDRLICKNNTSPLSWQTRIQIATDICSALIFMHTSQPDSIIHGNLKPHNVLLDDNLSCKITDFSISNVMSYTETKSERVARIYSTVKNCSMKYIDPSFLTTGELTPKSDVYSFGIILLRLLTGLNTVGIAMNVKNALVRDDLDNVLDPSAGDWPLVYAVLIARLGLSCCDLNPENRPDLEFDVLRVLQPMNALGTGLGSGSGQGLSIINPTSEDSEQPPHHFRCPISMEIMEDPHMAADGFTYEGRDIRKWLDSGCYTSPMTGLRLENLILTPNRSLRSGIQEWLQQCQNV
ncbi:U-box domain-containing protein 33-like isoform X2 [Silene latifolia]